MNLKTINLKILLFAAARDLCETSEAQIELPQSATVADLKVELIKSFPQLQPILSRSAISVNHQYADDQVELNESSEVAIIPPVSGG